MGVPYPIVRGPTFAQKPSEGGGPVRSRWWCAPCDRYFPSEHELAEHRASKHGETAAGGEPASREVETMGQVVPNEPRPVNCAANLFLVRRRLGISRAALAAKTGVPEQALALFENGWVDLWNEDKADIAKALAVPFSILWGPSTDVVLAWLERPEATKAG